VRDNGGVTLEKAAWRLPVARRTDGYYRSVICGLLLVSKTAHRWTGVWLAGLAAATHQGWPANIFTTASDRFPRHVVASVVGFGDMAGAVVGMLMAKIVGYILEWTGSYLPRLIRAYLVVLAHVHVLAPKLQPVQAAIE